jgi:hypothetical protein
MSRMDILTNSEINNLLSTSKLVKKYNKEIDRVSAYEILNNKIERAEAEEAKEKARKEQEAFKKVNTYRGRTTVRRSTAMNPVIKVLTSATFIRSVFGILTKVMKK